MIEVSPAPREATGCEVSAFQHACRRFTCVYDVARPVGQSTGKRQHHPFRVVKLINRASPVLLQVLANNERLNTVTIDMWVASLAGKEVHIFTYHYSDSSRLRQ